MKIFTKEILKQLPTLEATAELSTKEQKAYLKIFNPCGGQTWFITAYDPETKEAFGFVDLGFGPDCAELGYIDMNELLSLRCPLPMERDSSFRPMNLEELIEKVKSGGHV